MDDMGWCERCANTGYIDCHCGGDLCICENNGEIECPVCHGLPDIGDGEPAHAGKETT